MIQSSDILLVARHCIRSVLPGCLFWITFAVRLHIRLRLAANSGDGGVIGVNLVAKTKGNNLAILFNVLHVYDVWLWPF